MLAETLIRKMSEGDFKSLSRAISLVENESMGSEELLNLFEFSKKTPVIGITGPPGAGKSTLVNALIREMTQKGFKVGIIAIDPTSPFNYGSLLGDRIRMAEHFNNQSVFIRSLATRGSLGGLSVKTIEVIDVMKAFNFDYIIIETVGVGQSEVEIAGLADTSIVVLVPEAGDEIQGIKSGLMEIADIFVVNKADREGADQFASNIKKLLHQRPATNWSIPVLKTVAAKNQGVEELFSQIVKHSAVAQNTKKPFLLAEKAYRLIQNKRMKDVSKNKLIIDMAQHANDSSFNLYRYLKTI